MKRFKYICMSWRARFVGVASLAVISGGLALAAPAAYAVTPITVSQTPIATDMTNGKVFAEAQFGNTLYIGGEFTKVLHSNGAAAYPATNIAAIDMTTGLGIPSFHPSATDSTTTALVRALAVSADGSSLYVGGTFDNLGGASVSNLGRVDLTTGLTDPTFAPQVGLAANNAPSVVYGLLLSPTRVYFGGNFLNVDGAAHHIRAAAVDLTGALDPNWKVSAGNNVRSLIFAPDGNTIFLAGRFTEVNGQTRQCLARVSPTTGALDPWSVPQSVIGTPQQAFSMVATPTTLYVGLGAKPNYAAAYTISTSTGTQLWRFNTVGNVQAVALDPSGTELFIGGHFGTGALQQQVCGNIMLHGLALLNALTGTINCTWEPQLAPFGNNFQGTWAFNLTSTDLWSVGGFQTVNGVSHRNIARFPIQS